MYTQHRNPVHHFLIAAFLTAASLHAATVQAEDIDLFRQGPDEVAPPNILFIIDNAANFEQDINGTEQWRLFQNALNDVLNDEELLDDEGLATMNIGFMVFTDSSGRGKRGGKVIEHIEPFEEPYRTELLNRFPPVDGSLSQQDAEPFRGVPKASAAYYALALNEARLYYKGEVPLAGEEDGVRSDDNEGGYDPDAITDGSYNSPASNVCRNFAIYVGSGDPASGENNEAEEVLQALGGKLDGDPINLDPRDFEANWSDEFARFLDRTDLSPLEGDQSLTTYVIHVFDESWSKLEGSEAFMRSIADEGGGTYFDANSENDIREAIKEAFNEILSVNSVFAATALPVSVNVRGTNLNQVYIGVFRPDEQDRPRWYGNLKLYQLNADSNDNVFLADVNGEAAQNPETGFIRSTATSFWTHDSTFWDWSGSPPGPAGNPDSPSDAPDGDIVERGGVAQSLRELGDTTTPPDGEIDSGEYADQRNIYTCTDTCLDNPGNTLPSFSSANTDPADFGLSLASEADALIDWVRGEDNALTPDSLENIDEDNDGRTTDVRASVHGDVLHSQPAIVNYGTNENESVVAFYGANDGMIHAVQGGKEAGGNELWAFVPQEFFGKFNELRENAPPGEDDTTSNKLYFADGNLTAYVTGQNDGIIDDDDNVYLYATMRRGGRFLYAFDVTDPMTPKFLWRIDSDTPGFGELGQTWSDARVGRVAGYDDPVVFFGAGYDPVAEDPGGSRNASQGRGLFAVNGATGELIWRAGAEPGSDGGGVIETVADMQYSMPAAPTPIDRDGDGDLDRVYIPDTGGQVWRINLSGTAENWTLYKLASVGADQEFQYPVDVVDGSGGDATFSGQYDAVLVGSGDRENPFDTSVTNHFYMFKDSSQDGPEVAPTNAPFERADLFDATDNTIQDDEVNSDTAVTSLQGSDGWYIELEDSGEKVVGSATTLAGTTFFNTNTPPSGDTETVDCGGNLGVARNYAVHFQNATATLNQDSQAGLTKSDRSKETPGGGFPPSPVPVIVEIDGQQHLAVISGTTVSSVPNIPLGVRERVFWNRENLD